MALPAAAAGARPGRFRELRCARRAGRRSFHRRAWLPAWAWIRLWIKDESRNPTASFKDRASAVVVGRAREIGAQVVVTASTGNAGAALAGMSAAVEQKAVIFAPRTAPPAKIAQLLIFGAQVLLVDGTYDDAFDLTILAAQEFGWYCRNTGYNPFTAEGKKTAALEIWEFFTREKKFENRDWKLNVFVSVGDGNIISGSAQRFQGSAGAGLAGANAAHLRRAGRRLGGDCQRFLRRNRDDYTGQR